MTSSIVHDFDKIDIKDDGGGIPCATCGGKNASKKCKKRHKGCAQMMWCDSACERKSHEKKQVKKVEDEEGDNVETASTTIDDAAIKKMMRTEDRKIRKKLTRKAGSNGVICCGKLKGALGLFDQLQDRHSL